MPIFEAPVDVNGDLTVVGDVSATNLGDAAFMDTGTTTGTVAAGDDPRFDAVGSGGSPGGQYLYNWLYTDVVGDPGHGAINGNAPTDSSFVSVLSVSAYTETGEPVLDLNHLIENSVLWLYDHGNLDASVTYRVTGIPLDHGEWFEVPVNFDGYRVAGFNPPADTVIDLVFQVSGKAGVGIPSGGTGGQVLTKGSEWDYDAYWADAVAGGGAPAGPAGGVLSGTYPDPGFAQDMVTQAELDAAVTAINAADVKLHAATHASGGTDPVTLAQSQITGLTAALTAKADDTLVVHKAGVESITGAKTFTAPIQVPYMGIGNPPSSDRLMIVTGPIPGTQAATYGQTFTPTVPVTSTTGHTALYLRVDTAAAAFTVNSITGLNVNAPNMGAGSSVNFLSGIAVGAMTAGASSNVGISIAAAGSSTLWLDSGALNTTANAGIGFGQNRDTKLYRSNVGELKTDGAFVVAGTSVAIGTNPASNGSLRLANAQFIQWRNAGGNADGAYIGANASGQLILNPESSISLQTGSTAKLTISNSYVSVTDGYNLFLGSVNGTKIGTATAQKLGFWNATPVVQPANTVAIDTLLATIGLRAAGGTANFAGNISAPNIGGAASLNVGTTAGTVAAGDDPRFGAGGGGGPPTGAAGGVLSGTYPDPGFAVDMATQSELDSAVSARALDTTVVHLAGTETVTGTKTFTAPVTMSGPLALGANPSQSGLLRLANQGYIQARSADNATDINVIGLNEFNEIVVGAASASDVYLAKDTKIADGQDLIFGTATGTKIGSATTQKLAFYGLVPIVQPANTVAIDTLLGNLGLRAAGGTANFAGNISAPNLGALASLSTIASAQITDGTIVNADISATAAIALSKLATDPLARANHTGTQPYTTVTGLGGAAILNVGTTTGTVAAGDDSRLTNSRTPTAHAATHASGGSDPVTLAESQVTNLVTDLAAKATDSLVVHLAGVETVTGIKTFTAQVSAQATSAGMYQAYLVKNLNNAAAGVGGAVAFQGISGIAMGHLGWAWTGAATTDAYFQVNVRKTDVITTALQINADLSTVLSGSLALGAGPALSGMLRLPNNQTISGRATNNVDVQMLYLSSANETSLNSDTQTRFTVNGTNRMFLTSTGLSLSEGSNIAVGTATGTKIGTATAQKLGFFNATPIVQPANTVAIDDLLVTLGLRATGGTANFTTNVTAPNISLLATDTSVVHLAGTETVTGAKTFNANLTLANGVNIVLGTGTGTQIGTATTQKIGFFSATPIVRPAVSGFYSSDVDNTIGTIKTVVQNLLTAMTNLGLISVTTPIPS